MTDPLFWLVLSLLMVTVSLTLVLAVAIPALRELARAARSAEKLFDTLRREFPPTLEAIRLTGLEISDLTDDVSEGVQSAGQVVKQVDQSLTSVKKQAQKVQVTTRGVVAGFRAAWKSFNRAQATSSRRSLDRLPASSKNNLELPDRDPSTNNHPLAETRRSSLATENHYIPAGDRDNAANLSIDPGDEYDQDDYEREALAEMVETTDAEDYGVESDRSSTRGRNRGE